jgi:hypothetical protein
MARPVNPQGVRLRLDRAYTRRPCREPTDCSIDKGVLRAGDVCEEYPQLGGCSVDIEYIESDFGCQLGVA